MLTGTAFYLKGGCHAKGDEGVWPPEAGQKGTQRLVTRFGAALVCVRYRYDERTGDNLTTAEIIVDRRPRLTFRYRDTDMVAVAVPYTETALREKLKTAGGRWNPEERVWRVSFGAIRGDTALVERIVRCEHPEQASQVTDIGYQLTQGKTR
jgi:hypothetical protein